MTEPIRPTQEQCDLIEDVASGRYAQHVSPANAMNPLYRRDAPLKVSAVDLARVEQECLRAGFVVRAGMILALTPTGTDIWRAMLARQRKMAKQAHAEIALPEDEKP